jgi:flavodoxin
MKTIIVYHSFSGVTRAVAERVGAACDGDLVEVSPLEPYSKLTAYSLGSFRARGGRADPVAPSTIDVSAYDLIVLGTPVWAWRPTPVTNGAVDALVGTAGKNAVLFATCGSKPGDTLQQLRGALTARGVNVTGEFAFTMRDLQDPRSVEALIARVTAGDAAPTAVAD